MSSHDNAFVGPNEYLDSEDCWQCAGEGGWNSCMEDWCPAIGGEEGCDDPLCWRRCDVCGGCGNLPARDE